MNDTKRTPLGNPIDPNTDAQQLFSDPSGLTGVTDTTASQQKTVTGGDLLDQEEMSSQADGTVSIFDDEAIDRDLGRRTDDLQDDPDNLLLEQLDDSANDTISEATPPEVLGEQSVSGDMPDPESDDDTLLNSHQVGLRMDEDYDNPQPLNVAADVAAAERSRRGS
ncbi:MAG: hypothetical protein QG639_295 [Patescibacteria group bacterium]|jgi:hypothetical protein|nr:hypothetical protein [Patescibacteria group bacterium]